MWISCMLRELAKMTLNGSYLYSLIGFCPAAFDCYSFILSQGASGGTIIIWKSSKFSGHTIFQNNYALSVELTSTLLGIPWVLTNVYAPCTPEGKLEFLDWFRNIDMPINTN
jgi:hypothetical protein